MSSEIVLLARNVGKRYEIYEAPHHRLLQSFARGRKQYFREFWALRDVSFDVRRGECVGIIGKNGSGKSTLLQIIAGTLAPTAGSVHIDGKAASLLELGSGFNREFTGRENVYMNGAIQGLSKAAMDQKMADIAAFADIDKFFDQPTKTYSSGMQVRLAFATAINTDPDLLIIDEALAVGDEAFQRKCYARLDEMRTRGVTILFCSHSAGAIVKLCDRVMLLDAGEKLAIGSPKHILAKYQKLLYAPPEKREGIRDEIRAAVSVPETAADSCGVENERGGDSGTDEFFDPGLRPQSTLEFESHGPHIGSAGIFKISGERVNCLRRGEDYLFRYQVRFDQDADRVRFGMLFKTVSGLELGGATSAPGPEQGILHVKAGTVARVEFRFTCNLNPGVYFLNAGVTGARDAQETYLHRVLDICMLKVMPVREKTSTGIIDFRCVAEWSLTPLAMEAGMIEESETETVPQKSQAMNGVTP